MLDLPRRCAATTRIAAVALGLTIATPHPAHAADRASPVADPARSELDLGLAAYGRREYAQALLHFERSYAAQPDPATLYAWAQASRGAGRCAQAIALYQRFIDGGAAGASREAALQNQARCREQIEQTPEPESPPSRPPPPLVRRSPQAAVSPGPPPPQTRPDRVGVALVGTGAAVLAVGVGVLVAAILQHRAQRTTRDYDRFDRLDTRIDGLYIGGGVALGLGAGLVTGGVIRMHRRRR